jgi:hypothetical protein
LILVAIGASQFSLLIEWSTNPTVDRNPFTQTPLMLGAKMYTSDFSELRFASLAL